MAKIKDIRSRNVFSSSGLSTVETTVILEDGNIGVACVPGENSEGKYSAVNYVDLQQNNSQGKKVLMTINNIQNVIAPKLIGYDAANQQEIDGMLLELDGTQNKSRLGASATFSVSLGVAKASAKSSALPLYLYLHQFTPQKESVVSLPLVIAGVMGGGHKVKGSVDFSDFFIIPASSKTFAESMQIGYLTQVNLKSALKNKNLLPQYSNDTAYLQYMPSNESVINLLKQTLESSNLRFDYDAFLGIDAQANSFFSENKYRIKDKSTPLTTEELISFYFSLVNKYKLLYIEDPFTDDDWEGWSKISGQISGDTVIAGDSMIATNPNRLQMALNKKLISGVSIKPIQIGTIYEALIVINIARTSGIKIIVARQNGDVPSGFLADFAVAVNADYVNFGTFSSGENVLNYNRLLEIEGQINKK